MIGDLKANMTVPVTMGNADAYASELQGYVWTEESGVRICSAAHQYAVDAALKSTEHQTYQAMEALIHNLNTMNSRAGAQVPFSSINYGTDTSPEARMAVKNLLLATEAGLGGGETPIFPVQIFKVKEGVNFNREDPNYDLFKLAIKTSAQRLVPQFQLYRCAV